MQNIFQAIAEGLAQELKPPPGTTITAHQNQSPTYKDTWQVLIHHHNDQQAIAIITLHPNIIVWTGPPKHKKTNQHRTTELVNTHYEYADPHLIEQLQEKLNRLTPQN